jgi:NAD(P)-dependent dehydrogenase (short-subunit alcohol dehydrogenase family)
MSAQRPLDGKVAIVTGAGGGIGAAYSRALAEAGASVMLADLNEAAARAAADELICDGLPAAATHTDVCSDESTQAMADTTVERFGRIDILVNNAALMAEIGSIDVLSLAPGLWEKVLDVNLSGPLRCVRAVVPAMHEAGHGKIINQASGGAFMPAGVYGVSKLGLVSLTATLARELAPHGIRVNAIAPGYTETDAGRRASGEESRAFIAATVPFPFGQPEDLCGTLLHLASPASDWMTGQTLNVDGGWINRL